MSVPVVYAGESQLLSWSDSSNAGPKLVLALPDAEALDPFKGLTMGRKAGQRLMIAVTLIGDDEQPVSINGAAQVPQSESSRDADSSTVATVPAAAPPSKRKPSTAGPICKWLALRCKEPEFQRWAAGGESEDRCVEHVRYLCGVESRAHIDGNADAERRFELSIRKPWLKYTNREETWLKYTNRKETT